MGIITVLPEVNQSVSATSSSYVYFWLTRYIACMGMDMASFRDPPLPPWWDPGDLPWDNDPADTEGSGA